MKLLERLLYEPQHQKEEEKVTDKVLTRSIITSVIGILFCMTCLFGLTWAWFSDSIVTSSNKITAATFDLDITVTEQTEQGAGNAVTKGEDGYYTLDAAKTYTVSLAKLGTAKTGFCHLSVMAPSAETATAYYTDSIPQIDATTKEETEPFVFTISGVSKIKFTAMWGQCPEEQKDKVVQYDGTLSLGTQAEFDGEETEQEEPELEDDTPAETTNIPNTTNSPETTGTPETNATEPPVTAQPEPTEPSAQTQPTEP